MGVRLLDHLGEYGRLLVGARHVVKEDVLRRVGRIERTVRLVERVSVVPSGLSCDRISVIDAATRTVRYEHDLPPYFANNEGTSGATGGTYPFAVVVKGNGTAYGSSDHGREVVVIDVSSLTAGRLLARFELDGNALGMTLDASQSRLYVAQDKS